MKKYLFFDIDGTLTDDNPGGKVLESTKIALKKLTENGHFIAIATGRAQHHAIDLANEYGFKNLVSDGGNGLTLDGKVVSIEPIDYENSRLLIDECLEKGYSFGVVINNTPTIYTCGKVPYENPFNGEVVILENFNEVKEIYKIFIDIPNHLAKDLVHLKNLDYMFYNNSAIIVEPIHKYKGIIKMVEHLGGNLEDVVVFGDGSNDISMMENAPISIAMGNAIDELKQIATYITKSNKDDGIYHACKHFGWID